MKIQTEINTLMS